MRLPDVSRQFIMSPAAENVHTIRASVPIPKFASLRGTLVANFGTKGTGAIYDSSAVFGFEVPTQTRGYNDRNFKSTALALLIHPK
jgi:hypothetical protein